MSTPPIPAILDVDTGVDDALALLLAALHPAVDLRAVTCVAGNTDLPGVVRNTIAVLDLAGAAGVPVAAGADRPLLRPPHDASHVHGADGLAGLAPRTARREPDSRHAVELMRDVLLESEEPVTVVALAPLTNLALLLRTHPEAAAKIDRVVMMGGSAGPGNATPVAEFNTWHDPEAAAILLQSDLPVTMYGLDVFYGPTVDEKGIAALEGHPGGHARFAGGLLRHLAKTTGADSRIGVPGGGNLGDAGAVCALIRPEGLSTEPLPVRVQLGEGPARGQTIVDQRTYGDRIQIDGHGSGREVDVARRVDGHAYAELFLDTMAGGGER
jgi:pyrimidine-specific ribonucleoside hydrolase